MRHTKRKLVLIMLISMAAAFVVIAVAFRLIIGEYVKGRASESLYLYMDSDLDQINVEETDNAMVVTAFIHRLEGTESRDEEAEDDYEDYGNEIYDEEGENFWEELLNYLFDQDYWYSDEVMQAYYADEILSWWEAERPEEMTVYRVPFENTVLYVSWMEDEQEEDLIRFYYVNVSSEEGLMRTVSIVMYILMGLCIAGACLVGFLVGKKIETDQNRQKQFFENASHELKTPLMSIQGYAEGLEAGVLEDTQQATRVILKETDKMTELVNDILSLSRLESGAYQLKKEKLSVREFLSECLTSLEASIHEKGLRVSLDAAEGTIDADRSQMEKAVRNILINAIRYAKEEIRILYDTKRLVIWDDGTPISQESLAHLFERFYTGPKGNTGIGMSLTKEIVERHGWKIKAENTASGVQFVILF